MKTLGTILGARPARWVQQTIVPTAFSLAAGAMLAAAADLRGLPESVTPAIVTEKGQHHRSWSRVSQETLRDGRVVSRTNVAYVELKNGMHFWDPERNDWVESRSEIELLDDGAIARHGPHKVRFSADFSAPTVIDVTTPDGKRLRSRVTGLAYVSRASGRSALIAEARACNGEVLGNDRVVYRDCFDGGFRASAVYHWTPGGLAQNIVFSERLPSPAEYQILDDPADILLEVWTEWFDGFDPIRIPSVLERESDPVRRATMVEPDLIDETLDLGATIVPLGAAFMTEADTGEEGPDPLRVAKNWVISPDGRRHLVERVSYLEVKKRLDRLPPPGAAATPKRHGLKTEMAAGPARPGGPIARPFPLAPIRSRVESSQPAVRMAMTSLTEKGFSIDYDLVGPLTDFTFRAGETYWNNSAGVLNLYGTTRLEGAVIKFSKLTNNRLKINGPLECLTSDYSPAYFVGKDDDSIGSPINGSSGVPGYTNYAARAIDLYASGQNQDLKYLHFRNCDAAIRLSAGTLTLSHSTVVRSKSFVSSPASASTMRFRNVLAYDLTYFAWVDSTSSVTTNVVENATIHKVGYLRANGAAFFLTNCIIAAVTNDVVYSGAYNYSNLVDTGVFTTVGAGAHYLAGDSLRNGGTTGIDPTLLSALRRRTTYGPTVMEEQPLNALSLTTMVPRDVDAVDQGFHYAPLDVVLYKTFITNAFVTVLPAMAIGIRGAVGTFGLQVRNNGALNMEGLVTNHSRIVRYNTVQEEGSTNWATSSAGSSISVTNYSVTNLAAFVPAAAAFRFVEWSVPPQGGQHLQGEYQGNYLYGLTYFRDCQFNAGGLLSQGSLVDLNNCLFNRAQISVYSLTSDVRNCTFYGGTWSVDGTYGAHYAKDCLFHETSIDGAYSGVSNHHNAYLTNQSRLVPNATNDIILTSLSFESGPLGRFYLPTNCPLINTSSVPDASTVGMFHMTTMTNQWKETNGILDCAFHYVAVGTNGMPSDVDGDGLPDFEEDTDNDGVADSDELSWLSFQSDQDYDGRTDAEEATDGTNPNDPASVKKVRLGYWRFNSSAYPDELSGELPNWNYQPITNASWSGTAAFVGPAHAFRIREIGTDGAPNINCRNGSVRFWFRPHWTSTSLGGAGSGYWSRLIELGQFSFNLGSNLWQIALNPSGTLMAFSTHSNGVATIHCQSAIAWRSNQWHQIALTYSPSNVALYLDGQLALQDEYLDFRPSMNGDTLYRLHVGEGIRFYPPARTRASGFYIGTDASGSVANGDFEELETFNYPLTAREVAAAFPNFNGAVNVTLDSDYDGRSDLLETQVDGADPYDPNSVNGGRLAYFRFNHDADWDETLGEQGQIPIVYQNINRVAGWSSNTLVIQTNLTSRLAYRDIETNGWANFNCRSGAIRFWFKPAWSSGSGPWAPFVFLGNSSENLAHWELGVDAQGSTISFHTASNAAWNTPLAAPVTFTAGKWHQIVFNYSPTALQLYMNGVLLTNRNVGVASWPAASDRANGLVFGNNVAGERPLNGQLDEIETFNRQLTASEIQRSFEPIQSMDTDLNGLPDLIEDIALSSPRPFVGVPFTVTGCIEAEQFDAGGKGIAYTNVSLNSWTNDYRASGMEITNCNDLGGGYCVDRLKAGDWMKYTLDVRVAQTYAIEPRVAGIGTGGVFHIQFFTNGSATPYATTGPLPITTTNWTNITYRMVSLAAGANTMKVLMTNNASGGYVARLNYISIYPAWNEGVPFADNNVVTISTNELDATDSWTAATNNAQTIQAKLNALTTNGAVLIPAGRWVVAQRTVDEIMDAEKNAAITIPRSSVELRGTGRTNTILLAHNRATTIAIVGYNDLGARSAQTNVTFRDIALEGRPHTVVTNANGESRWEDGALAPGSLNTGNLIVSLGEATNRPNVNVLFTNCIFRNPGISAVSFPGQNRNCAFRNCEIVYLDGTNGTYLGQVTQPSATTAPNPPTLAAIMARAGGCENLVVLDNVFIGNPSLNMVTNKIGVNGAAGADGIVWCQGSGNWFVGRNVITNYGLEGVQFNAGPAAAVGNVFHTLVNSQSACALNGYPVWPSIMGSNQDYVYSFVGNEVMGGRYAHLGSIFVILNLPHAIHLTGNRVSVFPAYSRWDDGPGALARAHDMHFGNICGNTLLAGGHGVRWFGGATNAVILKNDFGRSDYRALAYDGTNGVVHAMAILKNQLNQGVSFHLKLREPDAAGYFLWKNTYTNGTATVRPFTDSASAPVHFIH